MLGRHSRLWVCTLYIISGLSKHNKHHFLPLSPRSISTQSIETEDGEDLSNFAIPGTANEGGNGICQTTPWSAWSECSATCGIGISMRTRTFHNHLGRKRCPHVSVVEKQKCMQPECLFEAAEIPNPMCPTSQWSDWSPCTATCGIGVTIRTRLLLLEDESMKMNCSKRLELHQQKECKVVENCVLNRSMAQGITFSHHIFPINTFMHVFALLQSRLDICSMPQETGPCRGSFPRYSYNAASGQCDVFIYGGCRGNRNNFISEKQCLDMCGGALTTVRTSNFEGRAYNRRSSAN